MSTRVGVVKRTLPLLYVQTIVPELLSRTTLGAFVDTTTLSRPSLSMSAIVAPEAPPPVGPYVQRGVAVHVPVRYAGTDVPFVLYTMSYAFEPYAPIVASKNTCADEIWPPLYA